MKKYNVPAMDRLTFEEENIITASAAQSSVEEVKSQLADNGVNGSDIKVTSWNDMRVSF
ncbi:MAG: hypothetical protein IJH94_08195 [Clostridia bacterium]|nr:hypothetical protein [Clostridia bacterium]